MCAGTGRRASTDFLDILVENFLTQFVREPTFGDNIHDLVISNNPRSIFNVQTCPPIGCTDKMRLHSSLLFNFILIEPFNKIVHPSLKATSVLGMLKRTFVHWSEDLFLRLNPSNERTHLEYCSTAWNPCRKKDIIRLEQVQRRATKLVPDLRHLNYESRLANLELTSLEARRDRGDLIQFYKIAKGRNKVNWHCDIQLSQSLSNEGPSKGVRGESHRITPQLTKCEKRKQFISKRVTKLWNKLPAEIVGSKTTNEFKNKFYMHSNRQSSSNSYHIGRRYCWLSKSFWQNLTLSITHQTRSIRFQREVTGLVKEFPNYKKTESGLWGPWVRLGNNSKRGSTRLSFRPTPLPIFYQWSIWTSHSFQAVCTRIQSYLAL